MSTNEISGRVYNAKIVGKKEIAANTFECQLEINGEFNFKSGQYIWLELQKLEGEDPLGNRRAFSIVHFPENKKRISVIFRSGRSVYKKTLLSLKEGSAVTIIGPFGSSFSEPPEEVEVLFMVAGGVGIAPFITLLEDFAKRPDFNKKVVLFNLNDSNEKAFYADELGKIDESNEWFHYLPIVGKKISIDDLKNVSTNKIQKWYISGPQNMVEHVSALVLKSGVNGSELVFEQNYPGSKNSYLQNLFLSLDANESALEHDVKFLGKRSLFAYKHLPWFILLSSLFALLSSYTLMNSGYPGTLYIFAGAVLFLVFISWYVFKKLRKALVYFGLGYIGLTLIAALFMPEYSVNILVWLSFFPIAAFLFLSYEGVLWTAVFLAAIYLHSIPALLGFLPTSLEKIQIIQTALSVSFISALSYFYELIFSKTGDEIANLSRLNKIFRIAVQGATSHMVITDTNGAVWYANDAAIRTTGFEKSEMIGQTPRLWGGLEQPEFYKKLWTAKTLGQNFFGEINNRRKKHELYTAVAHISPIRNEQGEIVGYLGIEEDITNIKKMEAEAKNSAERLKLATISAKIGVWEWDVEKNVLTWDDQMYALYGIKKEDFGGAYEAWQKGLHPDDKKSGEEAIQAALKNEKEFNPIFRVVWPSGAIRYIQAYALVERNASGKPIRMVGVNWDVTGEKIIDQQKTEFVSLASHQLKTPIGSIQWDLEMLIAGDYGSITDKQKEILDEVYTMSKRMNDLVNALLNISRIEMGVFIIEPKPTDFVKLCEEVIVEMEPRRLKKGHELIKNFDADIPRIPADEKLLRIVYQNFISNAIKYTQDNGKIKVILHIDDKNITFSVANNGEPIPQADQTKIFSKMFRASNAQEQDPDGNGLGLYMVKQIVENAGGKIWFTSKKGEDTVFACSFPLSGMIAKFGTKQLS